METERLTQEIIKIASEVLQREINCATQLLNGKDGIDSMNVMELITEIESTYDISFEDDIELDFLEDINSLVKKVDYLIGGKSEMKRPYIFCHMLTSLDGKIMGSYMNTPEGEIATDVFYNIAFGANPHYHHQGWMCGRITSDDNFTFYEKPELDEQDQTVPDGDFVADTDLGMYYVSIDPSGKLGWKSSKLTYIDTNAHVIEVLTGEATNAYKAFLRKLGISYILAGEKTLDYGVAMEKIKRLFGIETLMLGGGGVLNWSFIQAGMCDELSIVMAATADGSMETPALFSARGELTSDHPVGFTLKEVRIMDGDSVWLRYDIKRYNGGNSL